MDADSSNHKYQLHVEFAQPFGFIRVTALFVWTCPRCGALEDVSLPALVDWWDRTGAASQVSASLGNECRRCGHVAPQEWPLLQYRRGDVPGLIVAFPAATPPEVDRRFITDVLAVASDQTDLEGARTVVSTRMAWVRLLWNRPLGPILYATAPAPLPETGEEEERWRIDTVRALDLKDLGPSLSDFLNAESPEEESDALRADPRLTSLRWTTTVRSLEAAPQRVEASESLPESEVTDHVAKRFERLRLAQQFGEYAAQALLDLDSPVTEILVSARRAVDSKQRRQLVQQASEMLAETLPNVVAAMLGNSLTALAFGDPQRSHHDLDALVTVARSALTTAQSVCGSDHEITCAARLNLAAALEERSQNADGAEFAEAESLLLDLAARTARMGSAIASDVAVNLVSLYARLPGERAERSLVASELLEDGKHIALVMRRDDRRSEVVTLVDEAAALRSRVTGSISRNAFASLEKVDRARSLDEQWDVLSVPERVLLVGNRVNSLQLLHEHDPARVPAQDLILAANEAVELAHRLNRLHPTGIDTTINAASVLLDVYSESFREEGSVEVWDQARIALEDALIRAVEADPRDLRTLRAKANLATAYGRFVNGSIADPDRCAELLQEVLDAAPPDEPEFRFRPAVNLGQLRFGQARWTEAADAYRIAREAQLQMIGDARTPLTKLGQILQTRDLAARRALALVQAHEIGRAIGALEENRAQLSAKRHQPSLTTRSRSAVIHLSSSDYGSVVIISLPDGTSPAFSVATGSKDIQPLINNFLEVATRRELHMRFDALAEVIGPNITGPVLEIIETSACDVEELEVVACGALASVPLHCVQSDGRCWIDRWRVRYRITSQGAPHGRSPSPERTLGVFDPDHDLPFARTERAAVKAWAKELIEPPNGLLRKAWMLEALGSATAAHLACHARLDSDDPLVSSFSMSGETITVADLELTLDLDLVVAPACQAGATNQGAPDELLGVGHAFVHAGASSVIASMWDADDAATAYVVAALYRELGAGSETCEALMVSQREAARITVPELLTLAEARRAEDPGTRWLPRELATELVQLCQVRGTIGTQAQLFPHPAEWGVLTYLEG